ncbi:MAG: hypothetical protein UR28_C0023G0011 [Candidatus Peregrinibacteria bacterium GW2011_GWF2_33_10]|nr:MAG: hypothetical protein UR28_C0023G0011 [Candidatus Peregrinibacteria bacterium GW2011_GWF2_33_10]OGJ44144.1 MAG: hypothetical protein A2272_02160 [Candidatus Peregrinibacteria bacterium RIFOXYA12_FULL_33_12]OGJ45121.1 MAG: hypothetical protein A2263_05200 [Candidatus Peregrinibacteria bacterium RIFOXYA2_FULL_33_21]OGJ50790.1 MAG: hypothetical protein A2307_01970 [Candidatus Peregrinibacteria bacterium RIFOXYB2_FULL_33_20]
MRKPNLANQDKNSAFTALEAGWFLPEDVAPQADQIHPAYLDSQTELRATLMETLQTSDDRLGEVREMSPEIREKSSTIVDQILKRLQQAGLIGTGLMAAACSPNNNIASQLIGTAASKGQQHSPTVRPEDVLEHVKQMTTAYTYGMPEVMIGANVPYIVIKILEHFGVEMSSVKWKVGVYLVSAVGVCLAAGLAPDQIVNLMIDKLGLVWFASTAALLKEIGEIAHWAEHRIRSWALPSALSAVTVFLAAGVPNSAWEMTQVALSIPAVFALAYSDKSKHGGSTPVPPTTTPTTPTLTTPGGTLPTTGGDVGSFASP